MTALRIGELLHLTSRTEDGQNKTVKEEKGETSKVPIRNRQDIYSALTDRETFDKLL
jgi:hypothetical protein